MNNDFSRLENESVKDYKVRICSNKEQYNLSWENVKNILNEELGEKHGESKYRKEWYAFKDGMDYQKDKLNINTKMLSHDESKGIIRLLDRNERVIPQGQKISEGTLDVDNIEVTNLATTENDELPPYKETTEILKDGLQRSDKLVKMNEQQRKDPAFLLEAHGYDPSEWELTNSKSSMWNQHNKQHGTVILYSSKITVKPATNSINLEDIKDYVQGFMKDYKAPMIEPTNYSVNGKLLEVNISDLHLNKLGYKLGVYDEDIAEKAFFHILNDVITRTKLMNFEKILFIWSHDFFNIDHLTKTTTSGTPQDTTMRYADMYKKGMKMLIEGIDLLKQVAPVETVQVGANHDKLTSYTMSEVLYAWFRDDENVVIDNDPLSRKYRKFGKCLIGFSHGDKEKKRLGKIMPSEARKEWGETLYVEMHAGHLHSEQAVVEENGVIVRHLSSPSGTDNWHFESGYVGAIPKAQHFIWDREQGLTSILHTPIVPGGDVIGHQEVL